MTTTTTTVASATTAVPSTNFPVVSFEPFMTGNAEERKAVAQKLYDAFHTYGWVYLKDFGISEEEVAEMFRRSKNFFDRPLEEKMKHSLADPTVSQGYTADGAEYSGNDKVQGARSHKEAYEHRRYKNDLCPAPGEADGFREWADGFHAKCYDLTIHVLRALAMVLDLDPEYFTENLKSADPQMRLLHYMSVPKKTLEQEGHWRINPHCDYGLCTILFQDGIGGLEVDRFHDGNFVPATPIPGTCVINVADLLMRLSNGRLRSTKHRVVAPQLDPEQLAKIGDDGFLPARYSTAYFVHPNLETTIAPLVLPGEPVRYTTVNAGEWRHLITSSNYNMGVDKAMVARMREAIA